MNHFLEEKKKSVLGQLSKARKPTKIRNWSRTKQQQLCYIISELVKDIPTILNTLRSLDSIMIPDTTVIWGGKD